jgi:hypothetical protein
MPAHPCSICTHPEHNAINAAMLKRGRCVTDISQQYGVGTNPLYRHYNKCIPDLVSWYMERQLMVDGENLMASIFGSPDLETEFFDMMHRVQEPHH